MIITTEEEYEAALDDTAKLMAEIAHLYDEFEIVSKALEEYEAEHYPIDKPSLLARIKFRLGQWFGWLGW